MNSLVELTVFNFFLRFCCCHYSSPPQGWGVIPYIGYIGMCGPKGYGIWTVLVINRVSNLADFGHFGHKQGMVFTLQP